MKCSEFQLFIGGYYCLTCIIMLSSCCPVQERYRGRAQIAYTDFDRPQVIAAELVLFDSPDCIGLLWKQPMDSFSLFSRASQLPGVPAA
jgi:hypothetical protein